MQGVKGAKVYDSSLNGVEDRKTLLHYNTMKAIMAALTGKHMLSLRTEMSLSELKLNNLLMITTAYLAQ